MLKFSSVQFRTMFLANAAENISIYSMHNLIKIYQTTESFFFFFWFDRDHPLKVRVRVDWGLSSTCNQAAATRSQTIEAIVSNQQRGILTQNCQTSCFLSCLCMSQADKLIMCSAVSSMASNT